jgi:hypothetical protein
MLVQGPCPPLSQSGGILFCLQLCASVGATDAIQWFGWQQAVCMHEGEPPATLPAPKQSSLGVCAMPL